MKYVQNNTFSLACILEVCTLEEVVLMFFAGLELG